MKSSRPAAALLLAMASLLATGSLALAAGSRAHASATPKGGAIRVFVSHLGGNRAHITITGAIGDYGTVISQNKQGKPVKQGVYKHAMLKHGKLVINTTAFQQKLNHAHFHLNTSNCSASFTATGPATIMSGTGAYAGAHGTVTLTAQFAGIAPKKANGSCNLSNSAPTLGGFLVITGKGRVSF